MCTSGHHRWWWIEHVIHSHYLSMTMTQTWDAISSPRKIHFNFNPWMVSSITNRTTSHNNSSRSRTCSWSQKKNYLSWIFVNMHVSPSLGSYNKHPPNIIIIIQNQQISNLLCRNQPHPSIISRRANSLSLSLSLPLWHTFSHKTKLS